ncbi:MAG: virulence RhuM family protein [Bacteroidetes bacterium]|nr:virulence RhuM family protein [Bacteroidota bacterium]
MTKENLRSDVIFYTTGKGKIKIEVLYQNETLWLSQKRMAELFGCSIDNISLHLKNIFKSKELDSASVTEEISDTASDGKKYKTKFFSLDAIIAVGYRVNSKEATDFRIWATKTLREYILKGFVLDDERLAQGKRFGKDYFDELLERIREIRASERRFYLKITDIYEQCSIDYNKNSELTERFFKTVQNKLHWAITGMTAAELVSTRANAEHPTMGLTAWKNAPHGKILKSDIGIAKNYLQEKEIKALEKIVTMYLDFAELQAERQIPMKMSDWISRLDAFLKFNQFDILKESGKISHEIAIKLVEKEYSKFRIIQDRNFESDFEKQIKKVTLSKGTKSPKKK